MNNRSKGLLIALVLLIAIPGLIISRSRAVGGAAGQLPQFVGPLDAAERIEQVAMMPYRLEDLHAWFGLSRAAPVTPTSPAADAIASGDERMFRVYDDPAKPPHVVTATLVYAGPVAHMYVDLRVRVDQAALWAAARTFEESIIPRSRAFFGDEASAEEVVVVLHTTLTSAGGYFSPMDALSRALSLYDNPRKLLVIGVDSYPPGTDGYLSILAHEFQHMIHAHQQPGSPAWFNEGLATLAQDLVGLPDDELALIHLAEPGASLTGWPQDAAQTGAHYGAANLFLRYYLEHYGEQCDVRCLLSEDAGNQRDMFARFASEHRPGILTFSDLVADWAVANVVNDPQAGDGRYTYQGLPGYASVVRPGHGRSERNLAQFGVDYLGVFEGPLTIEFDGQDVVSLTGTQPAAGEWMWWSNRGDGKFATLTRSFDLSGVSRATLRFSTWYEIERNFDYGYVTVSTDGGRTWRPLPGSTTTLGDPQGQNLGHGLTGVSGRPRVEVGKALRGRWVEESMDLTAYAGREILLRFWLVNDADFNGPGLLLDRICIPQIGYCDGAEDEPQEWQAQGFVRTTGSIPQAWEVRLAVLTDAGVTTVRDVMLDADNRATVRVRAGEKGVLVVLATAGHTHEPARYDVRVSRD